MQLDIDPGGSARISACGRPVAMRALLKRATHSHHIAVEKAFDLSRRVRDIPSYRALLSRLLGFHEPLEFALSRVVGYESVGLRFEPRRKSSWLRADLSALGSSATQIDSTPMCPALPPANDLAAALGCLYVLEGSTLGGKIIVRTVMNRLGVTPATGAAFFSSYGDRVEPMWAEFCSAIQAFGEDSVACQQSMIAAAQDTFTRLERWLCNDPS